MRHVDDVLIFIFCLFGLTFSSRRGEKRRGLGGARRARPRWFGLLLDSASVRSDIRHLGREIGDEEMKVLCVALGKNKTLHTLDLNCSLCRSYAPERV